MRSAQADISTKCGGIDAATTTRQRRLCVAYDGEHKVWHLVPPETLNNADAGEGNAQEVPLLQEAGAPCPVGREMRPFFHLQEKHVASGTSPCSTKTNKRVSGGDQVDGGIQSGYVDDDVDSEQGARGKGRREITIEGGSTLVEARAMPAGVEEEHIPVKEKSDKSVAGDDGGNGSSVSSAEKVRLEDDCRAMVAAAAAAAAAACGQMVRTKNVAEGVMFNMSDGHQWQKPGNNDEFKGFSRELNFAEGAGKEPRKGKKIDGARVDEAAEPDGGQRGNSIHINEENPRVFQSSVGSSTELRYSRTGPLTNQNGVMSPTSRRSLSIGQARVTWRGATVDPTETWAVILKETRPGQPRAENKYKRSNLRPGSSLGGAKGSQDNTDIGSSHGLPAVVSNGKGQEGFKGAANNATPSFSHDKRRLMATQDEQRPSTSHHTLVKGDLKLWHEQGQKDQDPEPKTFWEEPKRGPSCSNHIEMLTQRNASNYLTKTRPVYFLSTPYAGPQIANCPRAWPNGVRTLSAPSDPRIREEAAKGGREQRTIVDEHKEMWFPESKK